MQNGMPPPGPPPGASRERERREPPKNLRERLARIGSAVGGFFYRLLYLVRLVVETNPWLLVWMAFFCLLNGLLPVASALVLRNLLNAIAAMLGGAVRELPPFSHFLSELLFGEFRAVTELLLLQFAVLLLTRVVSRVSSIVNNLAGEQVTNHIKLKIMNQAKTVDMASFDSPAFYEKLENANREAGMRPLHILRSTFDLISAAISTVSFIVILAGVHPLAPLVVFLFALPTAIVNVVYRNRSFRYIRHHSKERRQMQYFAQTVVDKDMAKEMRIMGLSDTMIGRYRGVFGRYYRGVRSLVLREGAWQIGTAIFSLLGQVAVFLYVGYKVVYGGGVIGDYSLYSGALTSISGYVSTLITTMAAIYEGTLFIDNMILFMKEKPKLLCSLPEPRPIASGRHTIEFRRVSFRYPGTEREVIKDVSLTLRSGETLVLVGLNGAGKTTLIKLMTRLYDPTEGQILLDGHDLREYDPKQLYALYGVIFQDFGRYAVSASDNIAFGDVEAPASAERVTAAAEQSGAADFIAALPHGYETPLMRIFERDGIEPSGGQWQKLSLARAFYKDAAILILDEPTASLDPLAEEAIFEQFAASGEDKITVLVSHRLSGATAAGAIAVMEEGELVEYGNHASLMERRGRYHHLFSVQAKRYTGVDYE